MTWTELSILDIWNRMKLWVYVFVQEYRIYERFDITVQYLEGHPFLCLIVIAVAFACLAPIVMFLLFTIVSLIITFMGFIIIEGTILGLGFAVMIGLLLSLLVVILTMALIVSTVYFSCDQLFSYLKPSRPVECTTTTTATTTRNQNYM